MTLVRWEPFGEFLNLHQRLANTIHESDPKLGSFRPAVDVVEKDDRLTIHAELPGIDREAIDIQIENGVLTLRGERKPARQLEEADSHRTERSYGRFERSFRLPETIDHDRVSATYKDGVLTVELQKSERAKPRRVQIQAA